MSVKREDNICTITFEDENWKEEAPEVFTVTDGAVPFYTADTWKYNKKNTFRSGEIGNSATSETTIKVMYEEEGLRYSLNRWILKGWIIFGYRIVTTGVLECAQVIRWQKKSL